MSYAEVIKLHDIKLLGGHVNDAAREEALRILLAIVLDSASAAWCLGLSTDAPVVRWPSSLYQLLARAALESSAVWRRCSLLLDRTLHDAVRCPAELVELFLEGRDSLSGDELAALLWCLIRRQSPSHDIIAERMSLELGVVAARRLHRATLPA
jgi:hypothetical protein